jgi:hypothetical protein
MAFHPNKDDFADACELKDSLMTLRRYLDGQAKDYEVTDALRHLDYVCCAQTVRRATAEFRACLSLEDETARQQIAREALVSIAGWVGRNLGARVE